MNCSCSNPKKNCNECRSYIIESEVDNYFATVNKNIKKRIIAAAKLIDCEVVGVDLEDNAIRIKCKQDIPKTIQLFSKAKISIITNN